MNRNYGVIESQRHESNIYFMIFATIHTKAVSHDQHLTDIILQISSCSVENKNGWLDQNATPKYEQADTPIRNGYEI